MGDQDQRRTHTSGHESHGVHVCRKCGWPFPNPHPSAKHRRAHKKICGTIEGYKLVGSDDEHVSDDDFKTPGLVASGSSSIALDLVNNEKGNDGIGEKLVRSERSEDDVFSDAVAEFMDSGLSPGIKERLQEESLDSGTDVEGVHIKEQILSGPSEHNVFNDVSPLIVNSSNDGQIENPESLQSASVEVEDKTVELQGPLSSSTVDSFSSLVADLGTKESTVAHGDDFVGLPSDSQPSNAEVIPDVLVEKNIHAVENVADCSSMCVEEETNLEGKNEIKSEKVMVEIVDSSDKEVSEIAISDAVSLDHQVGDGVGNLKEKNGAVLVSLLPQDDFPLELNPSVITNDAQVESAHTTQFAILDDRPDATYLQSDYGDHEGVIFPNPSSLHLSDSLEDKEDGLMGTITEEDDFHFITSQLSEKSNILSSDMHVMDSSVKSEQVSSEPMTEDITQFATLDDRPVVTYLQSYYGDHKGVIFPNPPSLHLSDSLEDKEDGLMGTITEEDDFHFITSQLSEKSDVLSSDMHVMDSSVKSEQINSEPMTEDMHAEDCTELSPVKLTVESYQSSHESGLYMNAMKTEVNENHVVHLSEDQGPVGVQKNSPQISLTEGDSVAPSNESQRDASVGNATGETTSVINIGNVSHHEEIITEVNNVALDGQGGEANVGNDTQIILNDLQPSDLLQPYVMQSSDVFKSDDAGEMGKTEQCVITDAQCKENFTDRDTSSFNSSSSHFEIPVTSDAGIDGPAGKSNGTECKDIDSLSGAREVMKEDEINGQIKLSEECDRSAGTFADSHEARDAELLVKAAEDLARKYTSFTSLNTEPSAQHDAAVEGNPGGEHSEDVTLVTAVPVQDQSGNNLVKHSSSGFDASVYSSSRCDSLEGHWGSVSAVFSMQSNAPSGTDTEILPSTGSLASAEAADKSYLNIPKAEAASERQQSGKSEMLEPPSFMTLVESSHVVSLKGAAASEVQKSQQPDSTSQAGWFPTQTQVNNESQGRKKNEEIIAKVTNWRSNSKGHTPLKSLLGEAANSSSKPESPKMEEHSVTQKNGNNGSGLKTVNSILGPESPGDQVVKGDAAKEWNSPARYPAGIKREKSKIKSRPFWIQLVCCSSVDPQRR
ncbi:uncharacterized protein LOC130710998 isoform X3 [Lotus japonicus]|uniref:uncharacterized protein LOC130710998 isoform X3 n=1 Tax=Lotus japonicus TaxID=34305 RepID=UPI002589C380|nr:uncharacterized protein LOC130710998 isoform X3 [Lotus japonicus]